MFSSFKEKLNTSLSTLQEKGLSTPASTSQTNGTDRRSLDTGAGTGAPGKIEPLTIQSETSAETTSGTGPENAVDPVKTADLTSLASPHSPTPSVPQPLPIPQQGSFGSIASRISSSASSSSLFFRRPLQATRSTADLVAASSAVPISTLSTSLPSSGSHSFLDSTMPSSHRLATLVQKLTLDPQEETVDPAELDKVREFYSQQQQSSGTELSTVVIEKLEVLRRYEARFPGEKKPIDSNKYHYFNNNHHYSSSNDNNDDTISSGNTLRKKKKRTQKKVVEEEEGERSVFEGNKALARQHEEK
ncbi:hypothetical protein FBU30_009620 [Linnemannia zychae]|nr:hypothetical protein FBU30_009620 [Linnemannia zychae]